VCLAVRVPATIVKEYLVSLAHGIHSITNFGSESRSETPNRLSSVVDLIRRYESVYSMPVSEDDAVLT
jgi:hypothetical protein